MAIDLKQDLSMQLDRQLAACLLPGENVEISLPGSFGEALVVTNRRVLVLREKETGLDPTCDAFTYQLEKATGAEAQESGTGGLIELKLQQPVPEPDQARVYFPSYDLEKFRAAAARIAELIAARAQAQSAPVRTTAAAGPEGNCPQCGGSVGPEEVFCGSCGSQLRSICWTCGHNSPAGAQFCTHCGTEMVEFVPKCPRCDGRIVSWMEFCSECGASLSNKCVVCGGRIVPDMKHCGFCGRLLGSDVIDATAARRAQRRLQESRGAIAGTAPSEEPVETAPAGPAAGETTRAAQHNSRGQEFFEAEEYDQAIEEFRQAVDLEPLNPTYHCNLAVAYDEAERDDEALAEYEKTLELDPNDLTALLSLGYMYSENEDPDRAQAVWQKVLHVAPDSPEAQEVKDNLRNLPHL